MSTTDTRAAFEALITNGPLSYLTAQRMDNGEYISRRTRAAWTAYQAATEAAKATGTAGERPALTGNDVIEMIVGHLVSTVGGRNLMKGGEISVNLDDLVLVANAAAARQPAPALPVKDEILKARQEGRMEALAIILRQDAESPFDDQVTCSANADAGDYSTYWNEEALRKLLYIDDAAYNAFDKAEEQYWDYRGYAIECENAEIQRRDALAATAAPVVTPDLSDDTINYHLNQILKASGSKLDYYTMHKTRQDEACEAATAKLSRTERIRDYLET